MLKSPYSEECLLRTSVSEWHKRFKEGRELLKDYERKGCPSTSRTEEPMEVIQKCLAEDQTLSVRMLEEIRGINNVKPEFQESGSWYLLHDNAPVHSSGIVSEFLVKQGIPVLSHPTYSLDIAPANFFLFPKLKIVMNGTRFGAVSSIQQTVIRELKAIQEEAFSRAYDSLYERCKRCGEDGRDYIE
jgi:hypothetical protein